MTTSGGYHKITHLFCGAVNPLTPIHIQLTDEMFSDADQDEMKDKPLRKSVRMGLWMTPTASIALDSVKVRIKKDIARNTLTVAVD
jgi:nicotinic acid mononucleotide adenylyltransferase